MTNDVQVSRAISGVQTRDVISTTGSRTLLLLELVIGKVASNYVETCF